MKSVFLLSHGATPAHMILCSALEERLGLTVSPYGAEKVENGIPKDLDPSTDAPACMLVIYDSASGDSEEETKWLSWRNMYPHVPMIVVTHDMYEKFPWIENVGATRFDLEAVDPLSLFSDLADLLKRRLDPAFKLLS